MNLEWEYLKEVFPFAFRWNDGQALTFVGRSLKRSCAWIELGMPVNALFEMHRPSGAVEAEWLAQHQARLRLVRALRLGMLLRGRGKMATAGPGLVLWRGGGGGGGWVGAKEGGRGGGGGGKGGGEGGRAAA